MQELPNNIGLGLQNLTQTIMVNMDSKDNPVNLSYLEEQADNLIESGKASKDGDSIVIDVTELGYDKVLAKGKITKSFIISAPQFSASAIEKIEEMGGEAIEL